jgi:hypothetical protein
MMPKGKAVEAVEAGGWWRCDEPPHLERAAPRVDRTGPYSALLDEVIDASPQWVAVDIAGKRSNEARAIATRAGIAVQADAGRRGVGMAIEFTTYKNGTGGKTLYLRATTEDNR